MYVVIRQCSRSIPIRVGDSDSDYAALLVFGNVCSVGELLARPVVFFAPVDFAQIKLIDLMIQHSPAAKELGVQRAGVCGSQKTGREIAQASRNFSSDCGKHGSGVWSLRGHDPDRRFVLIWDQVSRNNTDNECHEY